MGQRHSFSATRNSTPPSYHTDDLVVRPGVFGFVSLLLGNEPSLTTSVSCADAIVDLAAEAKELSSLAELADSPQNALEFSPYVLSEQSTLLEDLPAMPPLTRSVFFNNSVSSWLERQGIIPLGEL